jgi:predicted DCC family thiol-disulfide oxidoreductase YuxK
LVLYDGFCGLCHRWVGWLLRIDRKARLRFAPLQGETAAPILARHPEIRGVDSLVWVDGDRVAVRSAGVLGALAGLGGVWRLLAGLMRLIPRPVRDRVYDGVARNRYRWFGRFDTCRLPAAGARERLLP